MFLEVDCRNGHLSLGALSLAGLQQLLTFGHCYKTGPQLPSSAQETQDCAWFPSTWALP